MNKQNLPSPRNSFNPRIYGTAGLAVLFLALSAATLNAATNQTSKVNSEVAAVLPPTIATSFSPAAIVSGNASTISFTVTNPSGNSATLSGIGFTDTLPAGLVVGTPNGLTGSVGGGTITATAGSGTISLSGATLAPGASGTFSVIVLAPTAGTFSNSTGAVTSNEGGSGTAASSTLMVVAQPTLGNRTLSFTELSTRLINGVSIQGVTFADTTGAAFNSPDGGAEIYVQDPCVEGNTAGETLTMTFAAPTPVLHFGVALSASATITAGFTVQLFDSNNVSLGVFPVNVTPYVTFSEGVFDYTGSPASKAVVTFNSTAAAAFGFDNVSFDVPLTLTAGDGATSVQGASFIDATTSNNPKTVTSYSTTIDWGDGTAPIAGTVAYTNSVGTVTGTHAYVKSGTYNVKTTITGTGYNGTTTLIKPLTVVAGPTAQLGVVAPASATFNTPFTFTVAAQDSQGNTTPSFTGTVHFTSSDSAAVLPADTALVAGTGTFTATLKTLGNQTITATSIPAAMITIVEPGAPTRNLAPIAYTGTSNTILVVSGVSFTSAPTATPNPGYLFVPVQFTAGVTPSTAVVTWDFGDGTPVASGLSVAHTYATTGTFNVKVKATDPVSGGSALTTLTVTIVDGSSDVLRIHGILHLNPKGDKALLNGTIKVDQTQLTNASDISVSINGLTRSFTFTAPGVATSSDGRSQLVFIKFSKKGVAEAQINLKATGSLKAALTAGQPVDAKGNPKFIVVVITLNGKVYAVQYPGHSRGNNGTQTTTFGFVQSPLDGTNPQ